MEENVVIKAEFKDTVENEDKEFETVTMSLNSALIPPVSTSMLA